MSVGLHHILHYPNTPKHFPTTTATRQRRICKPKMNERMINTPMFTLHTTTSRNAVLHYCSTLLEDMLHWTQMQMCQV